MYNQLLYYSKARNICFLGISCYLFYVFCLMYFENAYVFLYCHDQFCVEKCIIILLYIDFFIT